MRYFMASLNNIWLLSFKKFLFPVIFTMILLLAIGFSANSRAQIHGGSSAGQVQVQASRGDLKNIPPISTDFGTGINLALSGELAKAQRAHIIDMLLNASGSSPSWPSFPRAWHEESVSKNVETSTYWHPRFKIVNGGLEINYQYNMQTRLVLITSLYKQDVEQNESATTNDMNYRDRVDFQVVKLDPSTKRVYPNIQKGHPMVGFCVYELQLTLSNGVSISSESFQIGQKVKQTETRTVSLAFFSKFFNVPEGVSIQALFAKVCEDTFTQYVRPQAELNFIPIVTEETFLHSPKNQCQPHAKDSAEGDFECSKWFSQFDRLKQKTTVPRCVTQKAGYNRCELKAQAGELCPLFEVKDTEGRTTVLTSYSTRGAKPLTRTTNAFPCDGTLQCKITSQKSLFSWIRQPTTSEGLVEARCF